VVECHPLSNEGRWRNSISTKTFENGLRLFLAFFLIFSLCSHNFHHQHTTSHSPPIHPFPPAHSPYFTSKLVSQTRFAHIPFHSPQFLRMTCLFSLSCCRTVKSLPPLPPHSYIQPTEHMHTKMPQTTCLPDKVCSLQHTYTHTTTTITHENIELSRAMLDKKQVCEAPSSQPTLVEVNRVGDKQAFPHTLCCTHAIRARRTCKAAPSSIHIPITTHHTQTQCFSWNPRYTRAHLPADIYTQTHQPPPTAVLLSRYILLLTERMQGDSILPYQQSSRPQHHQNAGLCLCSLLSIDLKIDCEAPPSQPTLVEVKRVGDKQSTLHSQRCTHAIRARRTCKAAPTTTHIHITTHHTQTQRFRWNIVHPCPRLQLLADTYTQTHQSPPTAVLLSRLILLLTERMQSNSQIDRHDRQHSLSATIPLQPEPGAPHKLDRLEHF